MNEPKPENGQRGIQSIEVGGQLLRALAYAGRALPLKDLALAAGMAAAKAHPYLPEAMVRPLFEAERVAQRRAGGSPPRADSGAVPAWARIASTTLADVRQQGLGRAEGAVVAGVSALSAPAFDSTCAIVLALTVMGPSAALDSRWDGALAAQMRDAAAAVSSRLGFRAAADT